MKMVFSAEAASETSDTRLGNLPEWNLGDLYAGLDAPEYEQDVQNCIQKSEAFEKQYAGNLEETLRNNPRDLALAIAEYEEIEERMGKIMSYAGLVYAGDTANPEHAKFYGDAQEKLTNAGSHLLFFTLELNQIDDKAMREGIKNDASLAYYEPWLTDLRKDKPYQLEERLEQLFHEKSISGRAAWNRLFDETMSSLEFNIAGKSLAVEQALNLLQDVDRDVRKEAAGEINTVLSSNSRTFTLITNALAKDKEISDRWRGFEDIADSRHLANRVEREVVDALVEAVRDAFPNLSHRYYGMKARWLGLDVMEHWDRNAPLPMQVDTVISWKEAQNTVLDAYRGFSPKMAEIAGRFFDRNWIDAPVRKGKSPGAFAHPTVPSAHPYVLLNYLGKPRDVMTLAHELGHGVHQVLAGEQGALMAQTPLTLAETASVFGEMLTFRALLARCENNTQRKAMLAQKVEDMLNTVVRQISFYMFERKVHTARKEGELTAENLGDMWLSVQGESLGPAFQFGDDYRSYWAYIPHFIHSPFYVYAYAFGDCLVNSLYAVYENAETGFQEKYFDMLRAGGTKHHSELLAPFGLDASKPDFWAKGLSMITGFIDELEALDRE
ncbi:MAG: M3 family oligoendopeptidase [Rhizobiaceae bacterium]|nr:M3 family oligoendopeptidase [Rhizobiaceae bacterium]